MKLNAFTILSISLSLPLLAVELPQVKPQPKPGIRPLPSPLPGRGPGRLPGRFPGQQKPQPVKWSEKQIVVTATIEGIKQGPTARSFPPIFNNTLTLKIDSVLRGSMKAGAMVQAHHAARQVNKPVFPKGKIVVALNNSRGGFRVEGLETADAKKLAAVKLACELPLGWKMINGKVTSPWVAQKNRAWPKAQKVDAKHLCATTGRPALMAGGGVSFAVEKMPPAKAIKFRNPDGDGEYKVTITNPTKAPLTIPALRTDGKRILWKESLVILCQGKTYPIPGSVGLLVPTKPVTLKPGQSLSTVIHALALEGPQWPRGGYRIEFQFCLGEKSGTQSFYYYSSHHDPIRESLKKQVN